MSFIFTSKVSSVSSSSSSSKLLILRSYALRKGISTSRVRSLKESVRDNPGLAHDNERHKQDALEKQKVGKGHWKAELASDSEEAIAAERNERDESLQELQKRTVEHAEDKHRSGTSQGTGL